MASLTNHVGASLRHNRASTAPPDPSVIAGYRVEFRLSRERDFLKLRIRKQLLLPFFATRVGITADVSDVLGKKIALPISGGRAR